MTDAKETAAPAATRPDVRLAKRVAELVPCSRREAEQYIEGGWVRVDGKVVEEPQFRVLHQKIEPRPECEPAGDPAGHPAAAQATGLQRWRRRCSARGAARPTSRASGTHALGAPVAWPRHARL